jgi:hypothetical protein
MEATMSWTLSVTKTTRATLQGDLEKATVSGNDEAPDERNEQVESAKRAALYIARSGALGDGVAFNVNLGGHANPEHKPRDGWANDYVSVSVWQA